VDAYAIDVLILVKRMRKFRAVKFGKEGYDFERAKREDPVVNDLCLKYRWISDDLSRIVYEMNKRIAEKGLRIIEPRDDPLGVVWTGDVFGDVKQWTRIRNEIRCLILGGERLEDHQRRLQRDYHMYPDKIAKPGIPQSQRNLLVKTYWEDIASEYEKTSELEKAAELEWRRQVGLCERPVQTVGKRKKRLPKRGGRD
jgi:hypothetical protein